MSHFKCRTLTTEELLAVSGGHNHEATTLESTASMYKDDTVKRRIKDLLSGEDVKPLPKRNTIILR